MRIPQVGEVWVQIFSSEDLELIAPQKVVAIDVERGMLWTVPADSVGFSWMSTTQNSITLFTDLMKPAIFCTEAP